MKIQCDVCSKDEASVFCTADEAALCDACDHRVHHANKLASKHQRFSLLHPSSKQFPVCDVCQERRALLFCQQDRAILCRECDFPIHTANEHTQKHNRFLLTGVMLSSTTSQYTSSSSSSSTASTNGCDSVPVHHHHTKSQPLIKNSVEVPLANIPQPPIQPKNSASTNQTSSISEYLIETLPGWHVEDFLDSTSSAPFGFCKSGGDGVLPFLDGDLESFSPDMSFGMWVPQAPAGPPLCPPQVAAATGQVGFKEATNIKANKRWLDDGFTVPQISPSSVGSNKRYRTFW
uniref:B box-type domain-containing protein n=1 Tax=Fagus sylvatica TaxID=28930 RepID=A0A2N9IZS0_FAGSY